MKIRNILLTLSFLAISANAANDYLKQESYWDIQSISNPIINPTGGMIIFSKKYIDKQNDSFISDLWVMDSNGSNKRFFVKGSKPQWSPDGKKIAFIKADSNDISQIFIKNIANESETQITNSNSNIKDFAWSKDGKYFSFSSFNEYKNDWVIDIPGKQKDSEYNWTKEPTVVTTMHWKSDGSGEVKIGENHLYLVDANGGSAVKVSDWGLDYLSDLQWLNNNTVLFTGNNSLNDLETPWKQSSVFTFNVNTKSIQKISPKDGVYSSPRASLDGEKIVFTGHPDKEYSSVAFDIWLHENKKNKVLTNDLSASPRRLEWIDSNNILFNIDEKGSAKLKSLNLKTLKTVDAIKDFNDQFYLSSVFEGSYYGIYTNARRPGEIARIEQSRINLLSQFNELVLSQYELGKTSEINYKSKDGTDIQGWYITPPNFDKKKKYPLILVIHGGPHAMYRPSFNYQWHQFASDGYIVLFTNPRGSTGYGSKFANIIDNDYPGKGDLEDLLAGVDHLTDKGFVNESRMYVQGCSGGGVLTAWVVGHDDRFAAAASLCPVTNWISMVGTTDIPAWTFEWFEEPFWDDPSEWLEHSPIMRTGYVKTPTLFMTGVLDIRTPMAQSEEMYIAFKHAGIETALIRMNEEWHGTDREKPTNWFRSYGYLSEWYAKYPSK
jgi:dipeptidyl aminopeptidase/acylaminoacyl peptidase